MDRLLSVSQAARMVGVTRKNLQHFIHEGQVTTFEGYIRMSELLKAYPQADAQKSAMLEKTLLLKESALFKSPHDSTPNPEHMATELQRTRVEITRLNAQVDSYQQLAFETEDRLLKLQDQCERREATMLGTMIGWYMNQLKLREDKA